MRASAKAFALLLFFLLAPLQASLAQSPPFKPGDRVTIGLTGEVGTVLAVDPKPLFNGGYFIKVHVDGAAGSPDSGKLFDTVTQKVTLIGGTAPLPPSAAEVCEAGRRVAAPTGYKDQWAQAVILGVDARMPNSCRLHFLGQSTTLDNSWPAAMLREPSGATLPIGPDTSVPYLTSGGAAAPRR